MQMEKPFPSDREIKPAHKKLLFRRMQIQAGIIYRIFASMDAMSKTQNPESARKVSRDWALGTAHFLESCKISVVREGFEHLESADLIFLNHQKPGMEALLVYGLLPEESYQKTRTVLKNELVDPKYPEGKLLHRGLKGMDPIVFDRTAKAKTELQEEVVRVSTAVFKEIKENDGCVVVFPEGTRSKDGEIGKFISLNARILENFLKEGIPPKITLLLADSTSVFSLSSSFFPKKRSPSSVLHFRAIPFEPDLFVIEGKAPRLAAKDLTIQARQKMISELAAMRGIKK